MLTGTDETVRLTHRSFALWNEHFFGILLDDANLAMRSSELSN
jgi:hypothetical protein